MDTYPLGMKRHVLLLALAIVCGLCSCSKLGIISEVYFGQVFSCNNVEKIVKSVKSETQCVHICLRYGSCEILNYVEQNEDKKVDQVCEVFAALNANSDCILLDRDSTSKAMALERFEENSQEIQKETLTDAAGVSSINTNIPLPVITQSSVSPSQSSASPLQSSASSSQSSAFSSQSRVSPSQSRVSPSQSRVSPSQSRVSPSQSSVSPSQSNVSPSQSSVSPSITSSSCCALATISAGSQTDTSTIVNTVVPSLSNNDKWTSETIAATPSSTDQTSLETLSVYRSCKEIYEADNTTLQSKSYHLESGSHYCAMGSLGECGAGGWTLAMSIDGSRQTFDVSSLYWINQQTYNVEDGLKDPYDKEAKYPAFNNMSFSEICIGMKYNCVTRWILLTHHGSTLRSIFQSDTYVPTNKGKTAWKNMIDGSSLQYGCVKEGINAKNGAGTTITRIGMIADNSADCNHPNSYIGLGTKVDIPYICTGSITGVSCGNFAICSTDNGDKSLAALGYIFIK